MARQSYSTKRPGDARERFLAAAGRVASLGLALGGALALLALAYFAYSYGITRDRQFTDPAFVLLYYGAPMVVAVGCFLALRLKPATRVSVFLVAVSTVAGLYGAELLLIMTASRFDTTVLPVMTVLERAGDAESEIAALEREWGVTIDARRASEVLAEREGRGEELVPIVTPSNHLFTVQSDGSIRSAVDIDGEEVMPLGAVSGVRTLLCNELGTWVEYDSDRHGFNNPDGVWESDRLDIAALGDSFTQGYCVVPDNSFVGLVRRKHAATLNLGIAGHGPLLMLATLSEYLPPLRPQIVLWCYFGGNDLTDLQAERRSAVLRQYLAPEFRQEILAQQAVVDHAILDELPRIRATSEANRQRGEEGRWLGAASDFARLSNLRRRLGLVGGIAIEHTDLADLDDANMRVFHDVLAQAASRTAAWDGQLVFVYLPGWESFSDAFAPGKSKRQDVLATARAVGLPVIDIEAVFQQQENPLALFPFRRPGHYTEAGHRLVAETILNHLSSLSTAESAGEQP